jgi:hypothetical protein
MKIGAILLVVGLCVVATFALSDSSRAAGWPEVKKLTASDAQPDTFFGDYHGVSLSGDTALVGGSGGAYVFERNQGGPGNWGEVKKLTASDYFGLGVALSGDTAVVGAYGEGYFAGAAYVFERNQGGPGNWGEVKKLTASDAQLEDYFGLGVALSGDTVIVGAGREDAGGTSAGAAYVFERNQGGPGNWGEVKKLTASDAQADDAFGESVALSGDTAVVGAPLEDAVGTNAGAAYVVQHDQGGTGNWGEVKKLTASDAQDTDTFGQSVALSGDTAVVGAPLEDAVGTNVGAAYVFQRDQGGTGNWGEVKKLTASDAQDLDAFGESVALSGDTAVVGAWGAFESGTHAGAAYVFQRDQGGPANWGEIQKLTASDAQVDDYFGLAVTVSGDTAVVGAPGEDAGGTYAGAAYVFQAPKPTPTVYNMLVTIQPSGTNPNGSTAAGSYLHCISRIDDPEAPAPPAVRPLTGSLICYQDYGIGFPGGYGPYERYITNQDGLAGPPPPPPYGFGELTTLSGTYDPVADQITLAGCFNNVGGNLGPALYVTSTSNGETGEGLIGFNFNETSADCNAGTPSGGLAPELVPIEITEQPDDFDHDGDGCTDAGELDPTPARQGRDPYNPYDCDGDFYNITNVLTTVVPQNVCKNQLPEPPCAGDPDGTLVHGFYYHCIADNQPNPGPTTIRTAIYCYVDVPGIPVNSHVGTDTGGDGLGGIDPPPPFGEAHNSHAVLTGTISGTNINEEGCIPYLHGALGPNNYLRLAVDVTTGQGTADIWWNRSDCNNPDPSPPTLNDVPLRVAEQGKAIDSDGDNCTDKEELSSSGALGGLRDPYNWGDFMSVHSGPVANLQKDQVVSVADISAVVARFGRNDSGGTTKINRNTNPKTTPLGTGYHPSYDRGGPIPNGGVPGSVLRQTPSTTGSGAGSVTVADISAVVAQFGAACAGPP